MNSAERFYDNVAGSLPESAGPCGVARIVFVAQETVQSADEGYRQHAARERPSSR